MPPTPCAPSATSTTGSWAGPPRCSAPGSRRAPRSSCSGTSNSCDGSYATRRRAWRDTFPRLPRRIPPWSSPSRSPSPPHRHRFGEQPPILTGRVSGPVGEPLPGVTITVTDAHGRQLLHSRTDQNGEYAATGFHEGFAVVVAGAPGRQPVATRLLLSPATPVNQDFVLTASQPEVWSK
ncbi:carboxypeptidase-like regulatory domain-containing protein [Actinoallomurus sp. CA-142502]|uniref:carboxypeptidase-like regulatory domain-containing protein n=1 Tax=Actinoallomurus sp. CA-142502 TaxID=3239885 RepID=UPI003D91E290